MPEVHYEAIIKKKEHPRDDYPRDINRKKQSLQDDFISALNPEPGCSGVSPLLVADILLEYQQAIQFNLQELWDQGSLHNTDLIEQIPRDLRTLAEFVSWLPQMFLFELAGTPGGKLYGRLLQPFIDHNCTFDGDKLLNLETAQGGIAEMYREFASASSQVYVPKQSNSLYGNITPIDVDQPTIRHNADLAAFGQTVFGTPDSGDEPDYDLNSNPHQNSKWGDEDTNNNSYGLPTSRLPNTINFSQQNSTHDRFGFLSEVSHDVSDYIHSASRQQFTSFGNPHEEDINFNPTPQQEIITIAVDPEDYCQTKKRKHDQIDEVEPSNQPQKIRKLESVQIDPHPQQDNQTQQIETQQVLTEPQDQLMGPGMDPNSTKSIEIQLEEEVPDFGL